MSEQVLGYERKGLDWEPIHECKRGYVYTCAFVLCSQCRASIRSMGGPNANAWCIPCKEKQEKIEKDLDNF
jgi:hypothetical protein